MPRYRAVMDTNVLYAGLRSREGASFRTDSAARDSGRDTKGVSGYRSGRNMKTIQASIPEYLARLAAEAAAQEQTTLDNIVAVALAAHVGAWQVRDDIETRAKRGNLEALDRILARVPNGPPLSGDEL
jgi:hypothetical protein